MANITLTITIPDDKIQALVAAINWDDGGRDSTPSTMNGAQVTNKMRLFLIDHINRHSPSGLPLDFKIA